MKQVDISEKVAIKREAIAEGFIKLSKNTIELIKEGKIEKGNPLEIAKLSGILASKYTPYLLPLCHLIKIENTSVEVFLEEEGIRVRAKVIAHEKTGVEMEALTTVAIALLNIWDVVKAYEKDERGNYPNTLIKEIKVLQKIKHA